MDRGTGNNVPAMCVILLKMRKSRPCFHTGSPPPFHKLQCSSSPVHWSGQMYILLQSFCSTTSHQLQSTQVVQGTQRDCPACQSTQSSSRPLSAGGVSTWVAVDPFCGVVTRVTNPVPPFRTLWGVSDYLLTAISWVVVGQSCWVGWETGIIKWARRAGRAREGQEGHLFQFFLEFQPTLGRSE